MKIYKVHKVLSAESGSEHDGYYYTSNKVDAYNMSNRQDKEALENQAIWKRRVEVFDVPLNKTSILAFLNEQCSHPDNG